MNKIPSHVVATQTSKFEIAYSLAPDVFKRVADVLANAAGYPPGETPLYLAESRIAYIEDILRIWANRERRMHQAESRIAYMIAGAILGAQGTGRPILQRILRMRTLSAADQKLLITEVTQFMPAIMVNPSCAAIKASLLAHYAAQPTSRVPRIMIKAIKALSRKPRKPSGPKAEKPADNRQVYFTLEPQTWCYGATQHLCRARKRRSDKQSVAVPPKAVISEIYPAGPEIHPEDLAAAAASGCGPQMRYLARIAKSYSSDDKLADNLTRLLSDPAVAWDIGGPEGPADTLKRLILCFPGGLPKELAALLKRHVDVRQSATNLELPLAA